MNMGAEWGHWVRSIVTATAATVLANLLNFIPCCISFNDIYVSVSHITILLYPFGHNVNDISGCESKCDVRSPSLSFHTHSRACSHFVKNTVLL